MKRSKVMRVMVKADTSDDKNDRNPAIYLRRKQFFGSFRNPTPCFLQTRFWLKTVRVRDVVSTKSWGNPGGGIP